MKLKFVLVPLAVLGFAVGSYADCSKDKVTKLIDKGFTKKEIKGICEKSESKKEKSKWITPSNSVCRSHGGKVKSDDCYANWENAKEICSASGGSLPSVEVLEKVVTDCGGEMKDEDKAEAKRNNNNSNYQSCYQEKGFTSDDYWSSTTLASDTSYALDVDFGYGYTDYYSKSYNNPVRCVRAGQ